MSQMKQVVTGCGMFLMSVIVAGLVLFSLFVTLITTAFGAGHGAGGGLSCGTDTLTAAPVTVTASLTPAAITDLQDASAARYIRELHALELLCAWIVKRVGSDEQVTRWYLSEQGLRTLAAMHHVHIQRLGEFRLCENALKEDTSPSHKILLPKGLTTMQRYPVHLAGVYGCIADLFHASRTNGATVLWWEAGESCARSYSYHGVQQNLRPDVAFELLFPVQQQEGIVQKRVRYWLEWDNGTMGRRDLEAKFQSYAHYCQSKAWVTDGLRFLLHLLFVVPDTGQETRIASAAMPVQDTGLRVFVTTAGHVRTNGFLSAIWREVMPVVEVQERRVL